MIKISEGNEGWFIIVFLLQYIVGLMVLGLLMEPFDWNPLQLFQAVTYGLVVITVNSILVVEGVSMLAEQFLRRREGRGEERGRRDMQKLWEDWYARRKKAEEDFVEFTEEPPKISSKS